VTSFHPRRRRRGSSLWPFYSYSGPRGPFSHPSDRSAPPCGGHQLSAAGTKARRAAESGLSSSEKARDEPGAFTSGHPLHFCAPLPAKRADGVPPAAKELCHGIGVAVNPPRRCLGAAVYLARPGRADALRRGPARLLQLGPGRLHLALELLLLAPQLSKSGGGLIERRLQRFELLLARSQRLARLRQLRLNLFQPEEGCLHRLGRERDHRQGDGGDDRSRRHRNDDGRVLRPQAEEGEAPLPHAHAHDVAEVGDEPPEYDEETDELDSV